MPEVQINGVSVKFPFEPYSGQKEYMGKIIESLRTKNNAILESPSGTGKTLSLLCATLAWIQQNNKQKKGGSLQKSKSFSDSRQREHGSFRKTKSFNLSDSYEDSWDKPNPMVIYATRTHSQILQAMKELKKTAYSNVKATVIASRHQLCIHKDLQEKSSTDKIYICKSMMHKSIDGIIESNCKHYENIDRKNPEPTKNIIDIEDLGSIGREHGCCPYFFAKKKSVQSDIIFVPYSYLIDPTIRDANDIDLGKSIVIIDEAHNVNRVCEDSASASIKDTDISAALRDLNSLTNGLYCSGSSGTEERLKRSLQKLKEKLNSMQFDTPRKGGSLFELLESVDITAENSTRIIQLLETLITKILTRSNNRPAENDVAAIQEANTPSGSGLKAMLRFFQTIYSSPEDKRDNSYRMYIEKKLKKNEAPQLDSGAEEPTHKLILHFWCFNPQIRMRSLLDHKIRCMILTSSTLTPFDSFIAELGVSFPIRFESEHVIDVHQKFAKVLTSGCDNESFDSDYNNRNNDNYLLSIGRSISEISKRVPGGLLVFFPSYEFMRKCLKFWEKVENKALWDEINQITVSIESQKKEEFEYHIKSYYRAIREKGKAIFIAVARGKISEGLDFSDIYGRAVMVIGTPLAPYYDPRIQQKRAYLDTERIQRNRLPTGAEWYKLDAIRTANQAMGRVIRHKSDYGAMLFCDRHYMKKANRRHITKWIRRRLNAQNHSQTFDGIAEELSLFYRNAEEMLPMREPELNPESFILHEDDEWFSTLPIPEPRPNESSTIQHADESLDGVADYTSASEISDQHPIDQPGEVNTRKRREPVANLTATSDRSLPSHSRAVNVSQSDDSDNESGVQPKRTKKSKKNIIESDSESDTNQDNKYGSLISFMKKSITEDKYKKLKKIVSKYENDGQYEAFRDELFNLFEEPEFALRLKGCIILFKKEHRSKFRNDLQSNR